MTVDLHSLVGPGGLGGDTGGVGPLDPEACRRLACDGAVTRVLVTRQPTDPTHDPHGPGDEEGLAGRLRAAMALLPPILGGAPTQPLEVGRTSRVVQAAQRAALAIRDGGCAVAGCDRPPAWCEATICATGCMAAPRIWPIWPCCAGPITGRSMRRAGG